jgi:hypothetical protein
MELLYLFKRLKAATWLLLVTNKGLKCLLTISLLLLKQLYDMNKNAVHYEWTYSAKYTVCFNVSSLFCERP